VKLSRLLFYVSISIIIVACGDRTVNPTEEKLPPPPPPPVNKEYGYVLDDYVVSRDTVQSGDSFGQILFKNHVSYAKIQQISDSIKDVFDTGRIAEGKPYMLLKSRDTTEAAKVFIYQKNREDYVVVDFEDEVKAEAKSHPVVIKERAISGVINSNLSTTFDDLGTNVTVAYKMADIYAWTIDFFKLQEGDRFKVVYEERFIKDTVAAGIGRIKACIFEHKGREIYAFRFAHDSLPGGYDYYDENADNLRRAFLKGPLKFNRISSRYNLKRRIKYYGYKVRPHKGTDFAGPIGTPYVKIRHNGTYETQYLHMQKRIAKVGDYVRQGDIIGTIGMTGNTGGPHVCYRFWKNGKQVDPFKEDLPASEPLSEPLRPIYDSVMQPLKQQLETINFPAEEQFIEDQDNPDFVQN